jgi:beta-phosphoglucomutase-like phosphatase (HAD superfamily)
VSFEQVLQRQHAESSQEDTAPPKKDEANYYFEIRNSEQTQAVIDGIVNLLSFFPSQGINTCYG